MSEAAKQQNTPAALMLLSSHCAYCPSVLDSLSQLIKSGELASLNIINLEQNPDAMQQYNVRSVPWVKIGNHELSGVQTIDALRQRIQWAQTDAANADADNQGENNQVADFDHLLSEGQVANVVENIKQDASAMQSIMALLGDEGTVLSTRIGIGVVFEEFAGSDLLRTLIAKLGKLTSHQDQRIRADAYHYLGLSGDASAIPLLEKGLNDSDAEVKEIATDSLEALRNA